MVWGAAAAAALALASAQTRQWDCVAMPERPTGAWKQSLKFVPSRPEAREEAKKEAIEELLRDVCGDRACPELRAQVAIWRHGEGEKNACAVAVLEERAIATWERSLKLGEDFDRSLEEAVRPLLSRIRGGDDGREVVLLIDKVIDEGIPGGPRATWLKDRMARVVGQQKVILREPPKGWAGDGVPPGIQAVLDASVTRRPEGRREVLEISWKARARDKGNRVQMYLAPRAVELWPELAPPKADPPVSALPENPTLSVRIEAGSGGSLCAGQTTQLYLHSAEDRFVQVFDLYGPGLQKALMIFPNEDRPDGFVPAGETIAIGGEEGFVAAPVGGAQVERFVVIGAPRKEQLGPTRGYQGYCRLSPKDVRAVADPKAYRPPAARAADGFRIHSADSCANVKPPTAGELREMENTLQGLPVCK